MTITLIMSKPATQLDASVLKKAYAFLQKITTDDTTPGLHIEPIHQAADPRVRTGRVDQQYRAVLFKLSAGRDTTYVLHGIWNHDEAIKVAQTTTLSVNPINGLPEIRTVAEERVTAALSPEAQHVPTADVAATDSPETVTESVASPPEATPVAPPSPAEELPPLIDLTRAELAPLGLPAELVDRVLDARSEQDLAEATAASPEWQHLAVVGLAAGMTVQDVADELCLTSGTDAAATADGSEAPGSDDELLASLEQPAAAMEFARIAGADELRRVIEGGDFGAWRVFLHPAQRRFAQESTKGAFRLSGGAGTGKTVVLLHRAARLARALPTPRVVMTTFTRNLADAMARDLQRLDPQVPLAAKLGEQGVWVSGIDAIARQVLRSAGTEITPAVAAVLGTGHPDVSRVTGELAWQQAIDAAGPELPAHLRSAHFFTAEYGHVILPQQIVSKDAYLRVRRPGRGVRLSRPVRAAVWDVVENYRRATRMAGSVDFDEAAAIAAAHLDLRAAAGEGRLADHVLVDEGQDLKPAHWRLLRALVDTGPDDLFIAEDSHQRIFGDKVVLSHYDIAIRGRSRRLTLNYRTTAQNLRWAVAVLEGGSYTDLEDEGESTTAYRSARRGPEPVFQGLPSLADELDHAAETVGRWVAETPSEQRETLAVLVRDSRQRELVVTGLAERGLIVRAVDREAPRAGTPVVMTMHRAKGTEFAKVLLFGVSEGSIPIPLRDYTSSDEERSDVLLRERSLLYVAASRARDELVVTWSGTKSPLAPQRSDS